jgi:very-short-patch-repair endonuclease
MYDAVRTAELERLVITILSFRKEEILQSMEYVMDTIQSNVLSLLHNTTAPKQA